MKRGGGGRQTHCEGKYRITYDSSGLCVTDEQNKSKIYLCRPKKMCVNFIFIKFHYFIEADIKVIKLAISRD